MPDRYVVSPAVFLTVTWSHLAANRERPLAPAAAAAAIQARSVAPAAAVAAVWERLVAPAAAVASIQERHVLSLIHI